MTDTATTARSRAILDEICEITAKVDTTTGLEMASEQPEREGKKVSPESPRQDGEAILLQSPTMWR